MLQKMNIIPNDKHTTYYNKSILITLLAIWNQNIEEKIVYNF